MAYNLRNINTLDLMPSTGVGVALPFSNQSAFRTVYNTTEQIKYNIINFLLTNPRERVFNPTFGAGIRNKLFEQISTKTFDDIEAQLTVGIQQNFPNVTISNLSVTSNPDNHIVFISFTYTIKNTGQSDNIIVSING